MYDSASPFGPPTAVETSLPLSVRAVSVVRAGFACTEGRSHLAELHESGALRMRLPRGRRCEGVLINTGGGITGGDVVDVTLRLAPGSEVVMTTQAAERIYRSDGPQCRIALALRLDGDARLDWLPQETILFDGARVSRVVEADVQGSATLTLSEMLVLGRIAHGERIGRATWHDRWRIRRDGRLVLAEAVRLDGAISEMMMRPAIGAGACAVATVVHVAPNAEQRLGSLRAALADAGSTCAASAWNGMLVCRLAGPTSAALRADVAAAICALTGAELPRAWSC